MYEDRIKWIEYKGARILSLNYDGIDITKLADIFEEVKSEVKKSPPKSTLYTVNVENLHFSPSVISLFNKLAADTKPWDRGAAVMGVKGLAKVMYDALAKVSPLPMKTFDKKEDALEWLVSLK